MNKVYQDRFTRFTELAQAYKLKCICAADVATQTPYVVFDAEEMAFDFDGDENHFVEYGIGSSKMVDVLKVTTVHEAEKKIGQLVYDLLNKAGFSVMWTGDIFAPIVVQYEGEFDGEEDNE